jgi:CHAT domain-containing protein
VLLYALGKNGLQTFTLPLEEKALRQRIADWRAALLGSGGRGVHPASKAPGSAGPEAGQARALYASLFGPLERAGLLAPGRCARLVLAAEGPLLDIPFAALMNAGGKRLLERYALSTAISLGILLWRENPRDPSASLLCVADPMGEKGQRLVSAARGGEFGALQHAREEGEAVVNLFPGAVGLVGPAARKAALRQAMGRYALLHFATHGYLDAKNSLLSALVLAPEPEGSAEDGMLAAREIAGIPLAARLAVLSACETGRGQERGGEGLQGLAWAFRAAGCPSVVASLWQVDDAATSRLMVGFYRQLKAGRRKDEALRAAMLAVKRKQAAPYYWAAFQVIGDCAPLPPPPGHR